MRFFCALVRNRPLLMNGMVALHDPQWRRGRGGWSGVTRQVTRKILDKTATFLEGRTASRRRETAGLDQRVGGAGGLRRGGGGERAEARNGGRHHTDLSPPPCALM